MRKSFLALLLLASCADNGVREAQRWNVFRCQPIGPVAGDATAPHGNNAPNTVDQARADARLKVQAMGGDTVVWDNGSNASGQALKCRNR